MGQKSLHIICKHCHKKNLVKKNQALDLKQSPACSNCDAQLITNFTRPLLSLAPDAFVHDLDRQMLDALKKIPGIDSVLRTLLRHSLELSMRLHHQGNFIKVSDHQLKSLHAKLKYAAHMLDVSDLPEIYVVQDARVNAYTFGVEKCSIAISSGLLDLMTDDEILSVIAHELGHIKARHVLYKTASRLLASLAESIAQKTFGLGGLVLYPLQLALLRWDRASELSSDRASLLVVRNPMVVLSSLMKMAGGASAIAKELNIDAFIEQAEGYEKTQDEGPLGSYIAVMNSMFNSHPFPIWRAREIIDWVMSGAYFQILEKEHHGAKLPPKEKCALCGKTISGKDAVCKNCNDDNKSKPAYGESIDKAWGGLKSWYDKNFNPPDEQ